MGVVPNLYGILFSVEHKEVILKNALLPKNFILQPHIVLKPFEYNDSQWVPMGFRTPLTLIAWTKTKTLKIPPLGSAEEKSYMLGVIFGWTIRLSLLLSTFYMGTTNKRKNVVRKKEETGSDVASEVQTQISLMSTKAQLVRACLLTAKHCFTYLKVT